MFSFNSSNVKRGSEVIKNLYYFSENQMLDCNQYIIRDEESDELILFDAGNGKSLNGLINGMKNLELDYQNITKIYLTHEHVDHVLGIYPLLDLLKDSPPEVFAFGETASIMKTGNEEKIFPGNLGISAHMFGVQIKPININELSTESEVNLNSEFKFKVLYTPGHSLGSACFYSSEKKILIPGDVVFTGGSFGRFDFPGGSLKELINSISKLTSLDVIYLLPGHMGISDKGNQNIQYSFRMIQSSASFF